MSREHVEDVYKTSPVQQGILFHVLSAPASGMYFEQFNVAYREGFDPDAFVQAWQTLIDRHPILRTGFLWENLEEPVQVVHKKVELPVDRQDWRALAAEEQEERIAEYAAADRRRGFELARAPLMRVGILRLGEGRYQVIWSYHHLLIDGWSAGLLMREIAVAYLAARTGAPPKLEPRRPFKEYIAWLRRQDVGETEAFWRRTLAGARAATPLPIDRGAGRASGEGGGESGWGIDLARLSPEATARIKSFAIRNRLTLNTLVQGAWAIVLARYAGREDVVFGTTVAGRPASLPGVDGMLGCFINTLPVRLRVPRAAPLLPWLKDLLLQLLELRRYEHTPLPQIAAWSEVPRGQPLFETLFVFESFTPDTYFEMSNTGVFQRTNYPLTLIATDEKQLILRVGYERHRFERADVLTLVRGLTTLLEAIPDHEAGKLGDLPHLPAGERVVEGGVEPGAEEPGALGLAHELFRAQAAATPEAPAVVFRGREWSYDEVTAKVEDLAARLAELGIGPEQRVGLCLERSAEMVVGVLGVLQAGAAYVPLDPGFPLDRLAYVAEDAGLSALVVDASTAEVGARLAAAAGQAVPVVRAVEEGSARRLPAGHPRAEARNLAYLLYTSGSTGKPKGVEVEHRALANFLASMRREPGLTAADTLLAVTTLSFDIAGLELLLPLAVGARLVVAEREALADAERLARLLQESGATVMQATPATWRVLLESELWQQDEGAARGVAALCGGEALPRELAERLLPRVGKLWNLYGPTEATIWSAALAVEPGEGPVPVGPPIDNTWIAMLDRRGEPVPRGVPGELAIGGLGVARGYFRRPALTAERFLPDPFADESMGGGARPGARFYRTGDLARFLPGEEEAQSKIEFLGRLDHQVKIRGFRIELGEIEAVLTRHPAVGQGVVVARRDEAAGARLVAYLVPREGEMVPEPAELRALLGRELPDYMVPSLFVTLAELPLTPNGKVDRKALPEPGAEQPLATAGYVPPRDGLEMRIARIYEEVLGRAPVGVTDRFLDLGGHSLLAVALIGRVRRQLGVQLSPAVLLAEGSVERLAAAVRASQGAGAGGASPLVPLQAKGTRRPFFCVHPIGGGVFCYAELARRLGPEQPFYGLEAPEPDAAEGGDRRTVESLAARYVEAMRGMQKEGPYLLGGWSMGGVVAVEMARQLQAAGQEARLVALLDAYPPAALGLPEAVDETQVLGWFADDLSRLSGRRFEVDAAAFAAPDAFEKLHGQAIAARLLPADFGLAEARARFALFRSNLEALARYTPPVVPGKLTLFHAAAPSTNGSKPPDWTPHAAGGVELVPIAGDHYSLLTGEPVTALAEALRARLDEAQGG